MTVELHVFNRRGRLSALTVQSVRDGLDDSLKRFRAHVPVENIDIALQPAEFCTVSGRAYGPESLTIWANPDDPEIRGWDAARFAHLFAHELHHVLRWRHLSIPNFRAFTAGEVIVLEGLAMACERYLGFPSHRALEISDDCLLSFFERLSPDVSRPYAEMSWIDETGGLGDEIRLAQVLGYATTRRYLAETGETPLSAVGVDWREVWDVGRPSALTSSETHRG
ncbi:MAG: DUF2268 domain-containing putative Zn-dependent protease [Pseudomonadota bacterium]